MPDKLNPGALQGLLGYHLRRAQNALFQHFARQLAHRDITPGQLGLLILIGANPGVSQSRLAREVGVERSTLGEFIDRFESNGLVERRREPADRRIHALHLTADGQRFLDGVLPEVLAHEKDFGARLTRVQAKDLMALLRLLA
jgi:DNA-binding MarR family transcriptional regulator